VAPLAVASVPASRLEATGDAAPLEVGISGHPDVELGVNPKIQSGRRTSALVRIPDLDIAALAKSTKVPMTDVAHHSTTLSTRNSIDVRTSIAVIFAIFRVAIAENLLDGSDGHS
jgi:hypothetical protein